jgi:hypothetical protein
MEQESPVNEKRADEEREEPKKRNHPDVDSAFPTKKRLKDQTKVQTEGQQVTFISLDELDQTQYFFKNGLLQLITNGTT